MTKREQRQRLIDSFVNAVYLYEEKVILTFNYKDGSKTITLEDVEGSDLSAFGALLYKEMAQTLSGSFLYRAVQTSPLKPVASRSRLPHIRKEDQIERFGPFFLCVNIVSEELTVQVITKRKLQAEQK